MLLSTTNITAESLMTNVDMSENKTWFTQKPTFVSFAILHHVLLQQQNQTSKYKMLVRIIYFFFFSVVFLCSNTSCCLSHTLAVLRVISCYFHCSGAVVLQSTRNRLHSTSRSLTHAKRRGNVTSLNCFERLSFQKCRWHSGWNHQMWCVWYHFKNRHCWRERIEKKLF